MTVSPFVKQLFVAASPLFAALSVGAAVCFPTVLLHQLKKPDSTITLDFDTASWIGAIHGLAGIPSIVMPAIMQWRGRKFAMIIPCVFSIIGWITAYLASSSTTILISETLHGFSNNAIFAVTCLSITEMISPARRDIFNQFYSISEYIAMGLDGLLAHYLHWKTISLIMCMPMIAALVITFMWPESPYWLAYKGKYEECKKAFIWLRGSDSLSNKELAQVKEMMKRVEVKESRLQGGYLRHFFLQIRNKDFYVPAVHIFLLIFSVHGTGSIAILIYSLELFQRATTNQFILVYGSLTLNLIQMLGIVLSTVLSKYYKKKNMLVCSLFGASLFLAGAGLFSFLQHINYLTKESLLCSVCLILYAISVSLGVMAYTYPIASALLPVKHRGIGGVIYVTYTCVLHTVALKLTPYLLFYGDLWGTLLVFAVTAAVCGSLLWKFVPDTNGRTLQEIENYYIHGNFDIGNTDENEVHSQLTESTECNA